nr:Ribonucleotide reductase of class Ia (aerobic)alpha subunit [Salmonella sp. NCTC 7297]
MKTAKLRCVRCLHSTWAPLTLWTSWEELAILAVRALDALLDYQDYPIPAAKRGAMGRRTLGIGVINFGLLAGEKR